MIKSQVPIVLVLQALMLSPFSAVAWASPIAESQPLAANGVKECFTLWERECVGQPQAVRDVNCVDCTSENDSCIKCASGYALVPKKVWSHK
jgi:hypothetical protein